MTDTIVRTTDTAITAVRGTTGIGVTAMVEAADTTCPTTVERTVSIKGTAAGTLGRLMDHPNKADMPADTEAVNERTIAQRPIRSHESAFSLS